MTEEGLHLFKALGSALEGREGACIHRYLTTYANHWPGLPAFVHMSSYVENCHKTHFGNVCLAILLIYPQIQYHGFMQWLAHQPGPMSSLFLLDVYACIPFTIKRPWACSLNLYVSVNHRFLVRTLKNMGHHHWPYQQFSVNMLIIKVCV